MNCVRCGHPISRHTGYGGKCMVNDKQTALCTCPHPLMPKFPAEKGWKK